MGRTAPLARSDGGSAGRGADHTDPAQPRNRIAERLAGVSATSRRREGARPGVRLRQFLVHRARQLARPGAAGAGVGGGAQHRRDAAGGASGANARPGNQPLRAGTGASGNLDRLLAMDDRGGLHRTPRPDSRTARNDPSARRAARPLRPSATEGSRVAGRGFHRR